MWDCEKCSATNWETTTSCHRCSASNPVRLEPAPDAPELIIHHEFDDRDVCLKCGLKKEFAETSVLSCEERIPVNLRSELSNQLGVMDYLKPGRFGEDETAILQECPLVLDILERRPIFEQDPQLFGRFYNVRIKPVLLASVLGAGGATLEAFDETIASVTRLMFDSDHFVGGSVSQALASWIGEDTAKNVNLFMDTVPRAEVVGGGWLHRIQHGHDIETLTELARSHGTEGVIQGLYHIYGRDFFTPAGIPKVFEGLLRVWPSLLSRH